MERLFVNVHRDGNDVYSYETKVAVINGDKLVMLGKYSSTTTRQMSKVAKMFDLELVKSSVKAKFEKLDYGANIKF